MKKIISVLTLAIASFSVFAQKTGSTPNATSIITPSIAPLAAVEALSILETEYDFGKIPQGKAVTHTFEVRNAGTDSLRLINVVASCGCTTPEWEKDKKIAVGATSKINVGYNAAAEGPFTKTITITFNENQVKVITIKGEVWRTPNASAPENNALNDLKN